MGLVLQVMILCFIAVVIPLPGSSGFGAPLSLEFSSPVPPVKGQAPSSILPPGPSPNGTILQPSSASPPINAPPLSQTINGPPPIFLPTELTVPPPEHALAASPSSEPPHDSTPPPAADPPHVTALPVDANPPEPVSTPAVADPPQAFAQPPPSGAPPPEHALAASPSSEPLHDSTPPIAADPPHVSALPVAANPREPVSTPPVADPPQAFPQPPPSGAPPFLPSLPPAVPQGPPNASSGPLVPPPLMIPPLPQEPPQILPSPTPPMPPQDSSPLPQPAPPQTPPPDHSLPPPSARPPGALSAPPPGPPNASFVPPQTPADLSLPPPSARPPSALPAPPPGPPNASSGAFMPPPLIMPPLPQEPPPTSPSLMPPPVPPHESTPLPQPLPPLSPPANLSVPPPLTTPPSVSSAPPPGPSNASSHTLVPPPVMTPLPQEPPPTLPSLTPPRSPHASSAPPPLELPRASSPPPPFLTPSLAPPPLGVAPPHAPQRKETPNGAPPPMSESPEPSPPSRTSGGAPPAHLVAPGPVPPASRRIEAPKHSAPFLRSNASEPHAPPLSTPAPNSTPVSAGVPVPAPPGRAPGLSSPANPSPHRGSFHNIAPSKPEFERQNRTAPAPYSPLQHSPPSVGSHHSPLHSPVKGSTPIIRNSTTPSTFAPMPTPSEGSHSSASAPSASIHKHLSPRDRVRNRGPSSASVSPPAPSQQGHAESPKSSPVHGQKYHRPLHQGSPVPEISPAPSTLQGATPGHSRSRDTKRPPLAPPIRALPPPPPNQDCAYLTCPEPFTNTPPGSPCGCVWPMQVGLRLSVALYTFFPLVSELAKEIAAGVFMKQSQVRVMGANAATQQPEKTIVLVDLVPLDDKFDNITSSLTFQRFWHKQVAIDKSIFGDYDVLYVRYPGLPPSPPMAPADIAVINGMPYSVGDPDGSKMHPLGVDVTKQKHKHRLNGSLIAVVVFSAIVGVLICSLVAWVLIIRHKNRNSQTAPTPRGLPSLARSSGHTGNSTGSGPSSSLSIESSLAAYTGSAKTFSASEIEKATDNFSTARVLGEGGFGRVYRGILEDETSVAVKVLKRDDQQGGREFLAEVEMLSRLHHRNLVKLIGICTDERLRCLVYELVPNGSVESHLHGPDRETAALDWASRVKIALGAARGLAYLHEDSSPRVIHRDFKASNILLENDFTAKVSDFGLARSAMDEENRHISTRVMGTFGYVAPEYAMTGHLLVKSDVYSYGVVLLELLTGKKPIDMSQPAGQENLVAWTRPLLTSKEGLESIIDPSLGLGTEAMVSFESVVKVAAIASMCVQPEVSHRPFMGEVVQALKLVSNECGSSKDLQESSSRSPSRENLSMDFDSKGTTLLSPGHDVEKGISVSEIFGGPAMSGGRESESFRRYSSSGPMRTAKRGPQFWERIRRMSRGSVSEHGIMYRLWAGSH